MISFSSTLKKTRKGILHILGKSSSPVQYRALPIVILLMNNWQAFNSHGSLVVNQSFIQRGASPLNTITQIKLINVRF